MTHDEINIAIAEACGWISLGQDAEMQQWWIQMPAEIVRRLSHDEIRRQRRHKLPSYTTDLNAMHEAEKALTEDGCQHYFALLATMTFQNPRVAVEHWQAHATARQRAEAFLRTIWKWRD
jgi:hypothetical protein